MRITAMGSSLTEVLQVFLERKRVESEDESGGCAGCKGEGEQRRTRRSRRKAEVKTKGRRREQWMGGVRRVGG